MRGRERGQPFGEEQIQSCVEGVPPPPLFIGGGGGEPPWRRGLLPRVSLPRVAPRGKGEASWKPPKAPSPLGLSWPKCSLPTWAFQVRGNPYIFNSLI